MLTKNCCIWCKFKWIYMNNYNLKTYIFALNLYSIWGIISNTGIITHVCNWLQPIKLITMPSLISFWSFIVRVYIITQNKSQMLLEIKIHFLRKQCKIFYWSITTDCTCTARLSTLFMKYQLHNKVMSVNNTEKK